MVTARRLEGRVALVAGAARGQGRAHAVRLVAWLAPDESRYVTGVQLPVDLGTPTH